MSKIFEGSCFKDQSSKQTDFWWNLGKPKIIQGKIEALQVSEEEKSAVGRKGAIKETAAEIKGNYMACDIITANPIPGTTVYTFLP
ncbi:hypothetical protein SLEP1_g51697 [Rubroshorea leprosula]|uniref:Uncharacterized protein n=1 Tax=Rubroshorea leprosula TaxID=152421 RepID=A0AAV5M467_9ROSI|nr:hypothetical protein SLEP1_g51697 [Rubroshorea leprosula]